MDININKNMVPHKNIKKNQWFNQDYLHFDFLGGNYLHWKKYIKILLALKKKIEKYLHQKFACTKKDSLKKCLHWKIT
jgi:hypothetical protein